MRTTELSLLSSAIINQDRLFMLLQRDPEIFQEPDLRFCRDLMGDLFKSTTIIDLINFSGELQNKKKPGINSNKIIEEIVKSPVIINYAGALDQLEESLRRTSLKLSAEKIVDAINTNSIDYDTAIDNLIQDYEQGKTERAVDFLDYINSADLDTIFESTEVVRTNIRPIDEKIYGIYGGQLILIASRPGIGKTSLAIEIMQNMNEPVLFFSLEMTRQEIYAKILSAGVSIESWKILFKKLTDDERSRIMKIHEHFKKHIKFTVFDDPLDLRRLVYYINHHVTFKRPKTIIIDYIQLLTGAKGENETVRIGVISRTLKLLAMKHRIPIIALSQLSRANDKENRKPELSDLRGSGSLEQDSNIVIFIWEDKEKQTCLSVAKNRMGRTGSIAGLTFEKQYGRFTWEDRQNKLWGYD